MVVGILGGGQLARMLALAGHRLALQTRVLDPQSAPCAAEVTRHCQAEYLDSQALQQLAAQTDVVTYEFENVPLAAVEQLRDAGARVYPGSTALQHTCDRWQEKQLFRELGIKTADFAVFDSLTELQQQVERLGLPVVIKTRSEGYDGKGQFVVRRMEALAEVWSQLQGKAAIIEQYVHFDREISMIAVRSVSGDTAFYPLSENRHQHGILVQSTVLMDDPMQSQAEQYAGRLMQKLDYVGVLALELFQAGDQLLANEYAPRVHNTGHWTMDSAVTCQFENHLRAVTGLPLGSTRVCSPAVMINLVGHVPDLQDLLSFPDVHLHLYNKQPRPGRKIGHINVTTPDPQQRAHQVTQLLDLIDR